MSGPRNNLDDILKKRQHSSTATTAISTSQSQSQDAAPKPKFRVASKPSPSNTQKPAAQPLQKTSSATSFATPGFGKKKPAPLNPVSNSPVVVTSTETSPTSGFEKRGEPVAGPITQAITSVPTKRNSPFTDPPSKRPRSDARTASDKENFDTQPIEFDADSEPTQEDESDASIVMVSHRDKGKGREIPRSLPPPPSSQRNIDFSQISTPSRPQGRDARSIVSGSSSRRAHAFSITTTSANTITSASARIGSSSTQYSSVTLPDGVAEDNQNNALRHLILDYSDMLTMSVSDLKDMKEKLVEVRSQMLNVRASFDNTGGSPFALLRQFDEITQDKLSCIDALLAARRAGKSPMLPVPKWAHSGSSGPSATIPALPVNAAPVPQPVPYVPPEDPPFDNFYEPDFDPSLDPSYDEPMRDPSPNQPIDVDVDNFDADKSNDPGSPSIDVADSDDALWGQFNDDNEQPAPPELEPMAVPPLPPARPPVNVTLVTAPSLPPRQDLPPPDLELTKTPFYSDLLRTLKKTFGLQSFRPNQLEACTSSMQGHDIFVLMPTGGGKSLCFQLPAVVKNTQTDGVTVVISPLVSLMHDQVAALKARGVKVACFVGDQSVEEANAIHQMLNTPQLRPALLYVTPEKLDKSERLKADLMRLYEAGLLVRIVADEAHCIVTWGRNFRDSYKDFTWIRDRYPLVPIVALTATANKQGVQDIISRLRMRNCIQYTMSFNRPNLLYEVRPKGKDSTMNTDIATMINMHYRGKTGIIYCSSREKCQTFAKELCGAGITAAHYHAYLPVSEKEHVQRLWQEGRVKVIVATIAFGMGIDKPDVRYIIHTALPNSLSDYYQETGRAGRDGLHSDCILYYSWKDAAFKIRRAHEEASEKGNRDHGDNAEEHIRRVVQYCQNTVDCRRQQVLAYFDEQFDPRDCNSLCDNCKDTRPARIEDVTQHAVQFIELVQQAQRANFSAARGALIEAFLGKMGSSNRGKGYEQLQAFGAAQGAKKDLAERVHDLLVARGILITTSEQNKASGYSQDCTRAAYAATQFLRKPATIMMAFRENKRATKRTNSKATNQDGAAAPASKRGRRPKKAAEIPEDPIDDYDEEGVALDWPEETHDPAPVAGPSTRTRQATAARVVTASVSDDEVEVVHKPKEDVVHDAVVEKCFEELRECRDEIGLEHNEEIIDILVDDALHMLSLLMPSDVSELKFQLADLGANVAVLESVPVLLPTLTNICLNNRTLLLPDPSKKKPPSKKALGTRSKPPSIAQLHNNYEYPGSASKPPSRRK